MGIFESTGKLRVATPDIEANGLPHDFALHQLTNFDVNSGIVGLTHSAQTQVQNTRAAVDNQLAGSALLIPMKCIVTALMVSVNASPTAMTADQNNKLGLYKTVGTDLSLVASTADSPAILYSVGDGTAQQNNFRIIPVSSEYTAEPGVYWGATVTNWSAITGSFTIMGTGALTNAAAGQPLCTTDIKRFWTLAAQNDLPATQAWSGVTGATAGPVVIPIGRPYS